MVVAKEPTVVDFVVVIEATANMLTHWEMIKKSYIRPAIEYFNGRQPSALDYVGNNGTSQFGYVLFSSADCAPDLVTRCSNVTNSPYEFSRSLNAISFSGGGCERSSLVSEGLGRTLQLFDELAQRRHHDRSMQVCFLVCNSPPYDIPCSETYMYNGHTARKLAEIMGTKGIHLSVISPQHIRSLKELYIAANHNELPSMNYAQDPRHLVLISGFQLPTERDPVKLNITDEQKKVKNVSNINTLNSSSATVASSVSNSPLNPTTSSTPFTHNTTPLNPITSPSNSLFATPVPQSQAGQLNSGGTMQSSMNQNSVTPAQALMKTSIAQETNPSALPKLQTNVTTFSISQNNQQQSQQSNFTNSNMTFTNTNQNISQPGNDMPFSRPSIGQGASNSVMAPVSGNVGTANLKDMLQPNAHPLSSQAQIPTPSSASFQQQSDNSSNMATNTLMGGMTSGISENLDQGMYNQLAQQQNASMQDQQQNSRMGNQQSSTAMNIQQAPPYSTPNTLTSGIQNNQQHLLQNNNMNSTFTTTSSSFQQQNRGIRQNFNPSMSSMSSGMMQGGNNMHQMNNPSMQQPGGNMVIGSTQQQTHLINNHGQELPATSTYLAASNVAKNYVQQTTRQASDNLRPTWDGILEWTEKRKTQGNQGTARTTHTLQCKVLLRANQSDESLNASQWPNKLNMQLIPQLVFTSMKHQMKNNISVSLRMSPIDQMQQLANIMKNKWMGLIQIPSPNQKSAENKVMLVIYSSKNAQFFGVLPLDPHNFIQTIRSVIARHQPGNPVNQSIQPRPNNPGTQQLLSGSIETGVGMSGLGNLSQQGNLIGQQINMPNTTQNLRPSMATVQQQPMNRNVVNTGMSHVRPGMQMQQPTQQRINYGQRMQNTGQISNQQNMMMNQTQSQQQQVPQNNMNQQYMQQSQNQPYMYQNNVAQQRALVQKPMDPNNDPMRQQQQQQLRMRIQQQNQVRQMGPNSHEQLRNLLQSGNTMNQNMPRPRMQNMNAGMHQASQNMGPGFVQNQQVRHTGMQGTRMMTMQQQQQQRFNLQ